MLGQLIRRLCTCACVCVSCQQVRDFACVSTHTAVAWLKTTCLIFNPGKPKYSQKPLESDRKTARYTNKLKIDKVSELIALPVIRLCPRLQHHSLTSAFPEATKPAVVLLDRVIALLFLVYLVSSSHRAPVSLFNGISNASLHPLGCIFTPSARW